MVLERTGRGYDDYLLGVGAFGVLVLNNPQ